MGARSTLGAFFLVASLLATPLMVVCAYGGHVPAEEVDALRFVELSVGNLGLGGGAGGRFNGTACREEQRRRWEEVNGAPVDFEDTASMWEQVYGSCNATEAAEAARGSHGVTVAWSAWAAGAADLVVTPYAASMLATATDLAVAAAFVVTLLVLRRQIDHVNFLVGESAITAADYSVFVRGLPPDATREEVMEHFSRLYNLRETDWTFEGYCAGLCSRKDWLRRRFLHPSALERLNARERELAAVQRRRARRFSNGLGGLKVIPTLDVTNTSDPAYLRSWVAEVSLAHPNGDLLLRYQTMRSLFRRVRRARARVKRFAPGSPDQDATKHRRADLERQRLEEHANQVNVEHAQEASTSTIAAFVIFQNEESRRRCVEDYVDSTNVCGRFWQPAPIRFRGTHPLTVVPAPEPIQILWESIEVTATERAVRQCAINLLMIVLLLVRPGERGGGGWGGVARGGDQGTRPVERHHGLPVDAGVVWVHLRDATGADAVQRAGARRGGVRGAAAGGVLRRRLGAADGSAGTSQRAGRGERTARAVGGERGGWRRRRC